MTREEILTMDAQRRMATWLFGTATAALLVVAVVAFKHQDLLTAGMITTGPLIVVWRHWARAINASVDVALAKWDAEA